MTTTRKQPVQMQRTPSPIELANAELARKQNELNAKNAASQAAPTVATSVTPEQLNELLAQMRETTLQNQAMAAQLSAQSREIAVLKAAKPGKAEKTQPQPENEVITVKGNTLTITVDLGKDTGKDIASKARRIVATHGGAFGFYNFEHNGVRHSIACTVYHDNPNFEALDKAYKAEKKAAK